MLYRGKTYPQIEPVQDRTDLLTRRHKVPWEWMRGGWLILIRDPEKASQRREHLSGTGLMLFSLLAIPSCLTLHPPLSETAGVESGRKYQAVRPAQKMLEAN